MNPYGRYFNWLDPQDRPPLAFCRICGGEIYRADTDICDRCTEDLLLDDD